MSEWISVKDRLPEDDSFVITINEFGYYRFLAFDGECWRTDDHKMMGLVVPVTHWMPLPEPPGEDCK